MIPLLTHPLALLALVSVPALFVIYRLRRRVQRRVVVSTLMLWSFEQEPQDGGQKIQRFRAPWLFFLELLILLLLCMAAVGPQWSFQQQKRPWIVVLDDSYSMHAGGTKSARQQAASALMKEFKAGKFGYVRLVLARTKPQILGGYLQTPSELANALQGWNCLASHAALPQAIGFAMQLAGKDGRVLVLTDQLPSKLPKQGRLRWMSFGKNRPNVAIINASRTRLDHKEYVLLSVANLSTLPQQTSLTLRASQKGAAIKRYSLSLKGKETRRITLSLASDTPVLFADLTQDTLPHDNHITLLPQISRRVRVRLRFKNPDLHKEFLSVLNSTKKTVVVKNRPDIDFTDQKVLLDSQASTWVVEVSDQGKSEAYAGPYVLQREHPVVQGLSLNGVIWSAPIGVKPTGQPLLMVGRVPLISLGSTAADGQHIQFHLNPRLSNLFRTPNWPILIWNVLQWRQSSHPGLEDRNVRLGSQTFLRLHRNTGTIVVSPPSGPSYKLRQIGLRIPLQANQLGVYKVQAGGQRYSFAVNALSQTESDLARHGKGVFGEWTQASISQQQYRDMSWLFALLALIVLFFHLYLMAKQKRATS